MKVIQNIIPGVKLYYSLKYLRKFKKEMSQAREAEDFEGERKAILKATYAWGTHLVNLFDVDLRVTGRENLPDKGPVVYVSNHEGYGDIPVYCSVLNKFQFGFVARENLSKVPLYGEWIQNIRSIMLKRDDPRSSLRTIEEGIDLINQGFSLLIFPEGTRSKGRGMGEFKKGSLRLATKPGVPVIPLTIKGSSNLFEREGKATKNARIDIIIHSPIETANLTKAEASDLSEKVEFIIRDSLATL